MKVILILIGILGYISQESYGFFFSSPPVTPNPRFNNMNNRNMMNNPQFNSAFGFGNFNNRRRNNQLLVPLNNYLLLNDYDFFGSNRNSRKKKCRWCDDDRGQ